MFPSLSLQTIFTLITEHTYSIFFPLAVVEGPIVTIIASFIASLGLANIFYIYGLGVLGDLIGDSIYYYIGIFGKKRFRKKGSFLGISKDKLTTLENHFENHGMKTLLVGKLTHGAGFLVLISAGLADVSFTRFLYYSFLGTVPKVLIFVLIGFYFGKAYTQINTYIDYVSVIVLLLLVALGATYFFYKRSEK